MVAARTRTARADAAARVQQIVNQKRFTNQDSQALKTEPQCQFWGCMSQSHATAHLNKNLVTV